MTVSLAFSACSSRKAKQEKVLRENLAGIRTSIDQYLQQHERRPASFSDLISDGYLHEIPTDPMTGRSDTWKLTIGRDPKSPEGSAGILDIHSGSEDKGSDGRPYSAW
jgi:general secretion pathway protein G